MNTAHDLSQTRLLKLFPTAAATLGMVVGTLVLTGWALDVAALKSLLPGWVSMKPNAALAFILTGLALLLSPPLSSCERELPPASARLGRLCGGLAGLIGLLTLLEYATGWNPGLDQWLFLEPAGAVGTSQPGRMAPDTALCFLLLAAGLAAARRPRPGRRFCFFSAVLGWLVVTLAAASILSYLTPGIGPYGWGGLTIMAMPTAVLFMALGAALVLAAWPQSASAWALSRKTTQAFAGGLLVLVFMGLSASRSQFHLHELNTRRAQTEAVLDGITHVMREVANAQTDTRGFVLTGEERFFQSYQTASARCRTELEQLRPLVADSRQQPRFARLEAQARAGLDWFAHVTATRRAGPAAVAPDLIRHGQDLIDGLRALTKQLENEQEQSIQQAKRETNRVGWFSHGITFTGTVASLGLFLTALLGLNRALGERKQAEEQWRASEERLHFALQTSHTGAWQLDLLTHTAQRTLIHDQIFGYETLLPQWSYELFLDHVLPDDRPEVERSFRAATAALTDWGFECRIRRADGKVRWIWAAGGHEQDSRRQPVRMSGIVQDITERKRAEEEIRQLNQTLEQRVVERTAQFEAANQELEAFCYSVSHDLRSPLRAIAGFARILDDDYAARLDDEGRRVLGIICNEAKRMGQLIDDLLAFSRMSRQDMKMVEIDLGALARTVFDECAAQAPGRQIEFKLAPLPPVHGDPALLRQALTNLFSNAIKYTRPRPVAQIEFAGGTQDGEATFSLQDNGVGFDMKYADKLFGVFQRLHAEHEFEGTGVGLAIVQRVMHRHGGRVWAEGHLNQGATFHFALPTHPRQPLPVASEPGATAQFTLPIPTPSL